MFWIIKFSKKIPAAVWKYKTASLTLYFKVLFMHQEQETSLKTLQDIRGMMEKSTRFISLSGWSGIWAGSVALAGSLVAKSWLKKAPVAYYNPYRTAPGSVDVAAYNNLVIQFIALAVTVFLVALAGAYYFTWRKAKMQGGKIWTGSSRRMLMEMAIPLAAGGIFALHFLYAHHEAYIAPVCLAFYGLALINGSKYTLSDIKYLGISSLVLGCLNLFAPGYGLTFWAIGFGVLHILYGIVMWNKYDKGFRKAQQ
ncbi:MAG: hypothetical protein EOP51_00275 [Sphingobacteriales bacterium]|nr:MAG: hypothetical protein EOP51_00275 [Sphingobacteriales bacterium]